MYSMWKIMCFLNLEPHKHISLHQIHKIMLFSETSYDPFDSNRCSLSVIERQSMGLSALREKKTYTDKTKLNPAARDDTLRSKDMKRSVYLSNGPLTLYLQSQLGVSMVHLRERWR